MASETSDASSHPPTPLSLCEARFQSQPAATATGNISLSLQVGPPATLDDFIMIPRSDGAHPFFSSEIKNICPFLQPFNQNRENLMQQSLNADFDLVLP